MLGDFELFKEKGRGFAPRVTLSKTGLLSFNDGAARRFGMTSHTYCKLYYSKTKKQIGVVLGGKQDEDGARKLRHRTTGADVSAKGFCDYYEIDITKTMVYDLDKVEIDNTTVIVIDLSSGKPRGEEGSDGKTGERSSGATDRAGDEVESEL